MVATQVGDNSAFLSASEYVVLLDTAVRWPFMTGAEKNERGKNAYTSMKKYTALTIAGETVLIYSAPEGATSALDQAVLVSHSGRVFDDLTRIHLEGGHCKAKTFAARVKAKHGKSIPRWMIELFPSVCSICIAKQPRKPSSAGHKPIITAGFGARGQVDLIDLQSCADGQFKYLLNYQDHGIKLYMNAPLQSKRAAAIAFALLEIFTLIGAPAILQTDNGREFCGAAGKSVELSDEEMTDIISELKDVWAECRIVHGRPRHSQSQGGIERLNRSIGWHARRGWSTHYTLAAT